MAPFLPALVRLDGVTRKNRSLQVPDSGVNGYSTPRTGVEIIKSAIRSRSKERSYRLAFHCLEELHVRLRVLQLVQQEFDGSKLVHRMQDFSQYPQLLQLIGFS